ncbi:hypothetical protein [Streptomyces sp. NPDC018352]|uniref:hypothetical protein n=1 Tax=Streptomyces sp. NPDC018352 TaxID=3157194 RepID=UPI00340A4F8A
MAVALWGGRLVKKDMRDVVISRTRSWLGKDTGDSRYRLASTVSCDWTRFQHLARTDLARHDEDGDPALRRALALVRGRPFTGIDPQRYAWAEPVIQEMVSAIVDVAYELSTWCREAREIEELRQQITRLAPAAAVLTQGKDVPSESVSHPDNVVPFRLPLR